MPSRILVVCTGNICRSPAVALLLDRSTDPSVTVGSAGTEAQAGRAVSPPMAELLRQRGVDTGRFAARRLGADLIADAALVVTMTRGQRSQVVGLEPRAVRRTFTLLELAALLADAPVTAVPGEDDAARLARVPDLAASRRGLLLSSRAPLDVPDPYGRPERVYRRTLATIEPAVETLAHVLHPPAARLGSWAPHAAHGWGEVADLADVTDAGGHGSGDSPARHHRVRHGVRRRLF